jgi:hypothetical protein
VSDDKTPFAEGERVVFVPDDHAIGWYQHAFERWGIFPGYVGAVTRVEGDQVELDGKGDCAMHWSQFKREKDVSTQAREAMLDEYQRRIK